MLGTRKKRIPPLFYISRKGAEAQRKSAGETDNRAFLCDFAPLRDFWGNTFFLSTLHQQIYATELLSTFPLSIFHFSLSKKLTQLLPGIVISFLNEFL